MRKISKTFFTALILFAGTWAKAQQRPMYTQYMFNSMAYNPAYVGSSKAVTATALYRTQWTQMEGAPKTISATIDAPLMEERMGLGLEVYNDKLGITQTTGAVASYAYRIPMDEANLAFGLQGSISQYKVNFSSVQLDPTGNTDDPAFRNNIDKMLFNFGTGVYYNTDKYYIGLSALDLFSNRLSDVSTTEDNAGGKQAVHFNLAAGYVFPVGEDFNLKPSFLIKAVKGAPVEADLNATLWIKNFIAVGAQYRTAADVSGLVELQLGSQLRLGYSYDYSTTKLQNFNSGSHEIMLRYQFNFDPSKIITPRYF